MKIVAVDPGNVTGIALYEDGAVEAWEVTSTEAPDEVAAIDSDVIVCESFTPRPGAKSWQPEALYTIGALRYIAQVERAEFVLQTPANAKAFSTNEKLKALGWYTPTKGGHANDALRHLLLYCASNDLVPPEAYIDLA